MEKTPILDKIRYALGGALLNVAICTIAFVAIYESRPILELQFLFATIGFILSYLFMLHVENKMRIDK